MGKQLGGAIKDLGDEQITPEEIIEAWKRICVPLGAPDIKCLNASRRKKLAQRIREHPTYAWWNEVFLHISVSPFLFGAGDRSWRADFDWLIANDTNNVRIVEGIYHAKKGSSRFSR
jgi:hypothetical protein